MSQSAAQKYSTLLTRLLDSGDCERALRVARDWLAEDPESLPAHRAAVQALIGLGRHSEAGPHLEKVLAGDPDSGFAQRMASMVSFHDKKFAEADKHIQRALELQPNNAQHWYHLAWMRYQQGALDLAARHAGRSLELQPDHSATVNLLAICERRDGKVKLAQFQRALELEPEDSAVHNNLGTYYLGHDQFAAAEESFRQSLRLNPADKTVQRNLLLVLRRRDRFYRLLTLPRTLLVRISWDGTKGKMLARILAVGLWLCVGQLLLAVVAIWFALVYPLLKAYEYLTLGDIRSQAGLPGARRGGILNYRQWPFGARFGIFAALTLLFWGTVFLLGGSRLFTREALGAVEIAGALVMLGFVLAQGWQGMRRWYIVRRGEKEINRQLKAWGR